MNEKPSAGISLLLYKNAMGVTRLTSPSKGRIIVNSRPTFTITINAVGLQRDLRFNPGIFGAKISDLGSTPVALPIGI